MEFGIWNLEFGLAASGSTSSRTRSLPNTKLRSVPVAEVGAITYNRDVSTRAFRTAPMIAHLSGTLLSKQATSVILDVGGVGYEITIPVSTFYDLDEEGATVKLRIYTHVREDALQLYGFKTARERELFLRLISVSGIGPKLGITLLSGMSADEMIASIRTNNLARLTLIPGVGRKTAERLVMELRDKVATLSSAELEAELGDASAAGTLAPSEDAMRSDVLSALLNLGYQRSSAEKVVTAALDEGGDISVESILRRSLRKLAKV
ncbi:MAG: holliday junction helicase RuvA [Pyrinomonadaceae bacterium]|nr:holliday junction helicase RuvA [Pyrinomonadaceae bacterium]